MPLKPFTSGELFDWIVSKKDFLLLDVRNENDFARFKVEGPYEFDMINVAYMDFMEWEDESVKKVPGDKPVRIVCAKEGSAKYVGEILLNHGFSDVGYLEKGIKSWGNFLSPIKVNDDKDGFELYQFRRPGKASCSYGLIFENEMMLFDPAKNIDAYEKFANDHSAKIVRTFETHRQADYISGSPMLNKKLGVEIMVPGPDFEGANLEYTVVENNSVYRFNDKGPGIKAIHTPGHTPGSTSYIIDDRFLISGDTVFIYSTGRPDLGGQMEAWARMLFNTIQNKIFKWDKNLTVLPGHYMSWEEADERLVFQKSLEEVIKINSEIYSIDNERDFVEYIRRNMRPQPEEYAKIREINAGLMEADEETLDIMDLGKNECAASAA